MRISDWSSDVCSSDLCLAGEPVIEQDRLDVLAFLALEQRLRGFDVGGAHHPPAGAGADGGQQPALGRLLVDQPQAPVPAWPGGDRKIAVSGKSVSVRVAIGGSLYLETKKRITAVTTHLQRT